MTEFYTPRRASRMKRRARLCRMLCLALMILSLGICIALCCLTNTLNAASMRLTVILIAILSGWLFMLAETFIARPAKADGVHMEGILADEKVRREATLLSLSPAFRIPGSIELQKARFMTDEGEQTFSVLKRYVRHLPPTGKKVCLITVRTTVAGWEEIHEKK